MFEQFGLNDVDMEYTDFSIKKKKEFEEYYWPLFENKNPNVPKSKWVMLVAAKWREFEILRKDREAGLEEEDDKVKVPLIKSGRKSTGSGTKRKSKLKIKLGHKKNGSDREEGEKHIEDSDEEFEKMFKKSGNSPIERTQKSPNLCNIFVFVGH